MILRFALFFSAFSITLSGLNYILLRRALKLPARSNRFLLWVMIFSALIMIIVPFYYRLVLPKIDSPLGYASQWMQYFLVGLLAVNLLFLGTLEFIKIVTKPFDPMKRVFLTEGVGRGFFATSLAASGVGLLQANAGPEVHEVTITLPTLPQAFKGMTITQISDIHIGPMLHGDFMSRVADQVMQLNSDLIFITGDLVDGSVEQLRDHVAPLSRLKAREGIYFCTGNHEYYSGVENWIQHLESMGIHVFKNTNRILTRKGPQGDEKILLAGVYDFKAAAVSNHTHDPKLAAKTDEPVNCKILLSHNPHGIDETAEAGFDLQFSGHTHAGQFFPLTLFMKLAMPYVEGLYKINEKTQLYINRGTGFWGPPNRLAKRGEITKITLA